MKSETPAEAPLEIWHEAVVGEDEIDELGHMNVRFYFEKAWAATRALAARHGLGAEAAADQGFRLELRDVYTRHYAEQMQGASLVVRGGVIDVRGDGLRLYHELVNPAKDEVAATFVHEAALRDEATGAPRPLPENAAQSVGTARVAWPEHGRPRTIDLDGPPPRPAFETLRERGLAMRHERKIEAAACDERGVFPVASYLDLIWGGIPIERRENDSWLTDLEDGGKMGWATLESRGIVFDMPRAGDCIQSFSAEVELGRKTSYRHSWAFDVVTGRLLCLHSVLNLAFDIGKRRSIEIPANVRRGLEKRVYPDLGAAG